ncbi:MAG TPA: pirin family protein, partial [Candidatus Nanoarchaeia archaeon]|nr:pirin family protein [Candidatus Nanoarchaeia archaeon]
GALEHKDSMGNKGIIKANEIQRMSAGTGIMHSEFNPSKKDKVHLLQIWIEPKENNIKPSYEQKNFFKLKINEFTSVVSGIRNNNSVYIHQNAYFSLGNFDADKEINYKLHNVKNGIFLFVIEGEINIENNLLKEGDTAEIQETSKVNFMTKKESKIIIIEVPLGLTTR